MVFKRYHNPFVDPDSYLPSAVHSRDCCMHVFSYSSIFLKTTSKLWIYHKPNKTAELLFWECRALSQAAIHRSRTCSGADGLPRIFRAYRAQPYVWRSKKHQPAFGRERVIAKPMRQADFCNWTDFAMALVSQPHRITAERTDGDTVPLPHTQLQPVALAPSVSGCAGYRHPEANPWRPTRLLSTTNSNLSVCFPQQWLTQHF